MTDESRLELDESQFENDLSIFIQEADNKIQTIRRDFHALKENPQNYEIIHSLLRGFHNIKSSAYSLNLPNIRRVAHLTEDLIVLLRDKVINIDEIFLSILDDSIDYIDEILINLNENKWERRKSPVPLILKLKEYIDGQKKSTEGCVEQQSLPAE